MDNSTRSRVLHSTPVFVVLTLFLYEYLEEFALRAFSLSASAYESEFILRVGFQDREFSAAIVIGLFPLLLSWRKLSWSSIDPTRRARTFVFFVALIMAITFGAQGYNYYYDQAHVIDRAILFALCGLIWLHPIFTQLFVAACFTIAMQVYHPLPEAHWIWPDKLLPVQFLVLFLSFLYVRIFIRSRPRTVLVLALILTGATYAHAGISKLALGPEPTSWLFENHISNILIAAHENGGWLRYLPDTELTKAVYHLHKFDMFISLGTLAIELAGVFLLVYLRASIWIIVAFISLHVGICAVTGILFWQWMLFDVALIYYINKTIYDRAPWTASLIGFGGTKFSKKVSVHVAALSLVALIGVSLVRFQSSGGLFAWWDSPYSNFFSLEAETKSGLKYDLDARFFTPYDVLTVQSRFYYVLKQPVLVGTYGVTQSYELKNALEDASVENIPLIKQKFALEHFNEEHRERFRYFITRYVGSAMQYSSKHFLPEWAPPPYHFQTSFSPLNYRYQSKITKVRVKFEERFFDGKKIHRFDPIDVMEIAVPH